MSARPSAPSARPSKQTAEPSKQTARPSAAGSRPSPPPRRGRLRRSDCGSPGLTRLRRGRGFTYLDEHGERIEDPEVLERLRGLAIPPAWKEVWICSDPLGHLQATGIDDAGRKQYLYHPRWREHRDREKFEKMVRFGERLPKLRRRIARALRDGEPTRETVLACAARLLDVGVFRIGSEQYADEDSGIGLATLRRDHMRIRGDSGVEFEYPAKGGVTRRLALSDPLSLPLLIKLRRRRGGPPELLAYRDGRRWHALRSDEINEYLKAGLGEDCSAKDFRTWHATVAASVCLAAADAATKGARKRAADRAVRQVAELLGNTPAVARRAYIDPRVFDRYASGWTIAGDLQNGAAIDPSDDRGRARIERAVVDLLTENTDSPALEREPAPADR